jgi:hypothetical protein
MKAELVWHEKRLVASKKIEGLAVAEIKIWKVPVSSNYPDGRKYSLFLILEGNVLLGIDNHKPKGPHLHLEGQELPYEYKNDDYLITDFWERVRKAGFEP